MGELSALSQFRPVPPLVHPVTEGSTMSRCLNKATLIGYLGADPEIRTISSGARVAQFSLGTTRRWNDRDGKPRDVRSVKSDAVSP